MWIKHIWKELRSFAPQVWLITIPNHAGSWLQIDKTTSPTWKNPLMGLHVMKCIYQLILLACHLEKPGLSCFKASASTIAWEHFRCEKSNASQLYTEFRAELSYMHPVCIMTRVKLRRHKFVKLYNSQDIYVFFQTLVTLVMGTVYISVVKCVFTR